MLGYIAIAVLLFIILMIIAGTTASKEDKAKALFSGIDPKKVYAMRDEGQKFKMISHSEDAGTMISFNIEGIDNLDTWRLNRVWALKDNEPLKLEAARDYIITVKTQDDVIIGHVPAAYSRVMTNHLPSLVDCYVRVVLPEDIPMVTCEAYYTDGFAIPNA